MEQMGLLHLYYGDGKGKTTAAMGLALRALGSGKKVVIVQFLKGGKSGEIPLLEQLGATVYRGKAGQKFVFQMNDAEKAATRALQDRNLTVAMAQEADLLVLDEGRQRLGTGYGGQGPASPGVLQRPAGQECVLTAHAAPAVDAGRRRLCDRDEVHPPPLSEGNCRPQRRRILTFAPYGLQFAYRCDMMKLYIVRAFLSSPGRRPKKGTLRTLLPGCPGSILFKAAVSVS